MSGFDMRQLGDRTFQWVDRLTGVPAAEMGVGTTDTDITYLAMRNATGVLCYAYPNAGGTGLAVSTVKP